MVIIRPINADKNLTSLAEIKQPNYSAMTVTQSAYKTRTLKQAVMRQRGKRCASNPWRGSSSARYTL